MYTAKRCQGCNKEIFSGSYCINCLPACSTLSEIVGQRKVVERLTAVRDLFRGRSEPAEHMLLIGVEGIGKCTIARAFAAEMGSKILSVNATTLKALGELSATMTSMQAGDALVLENVQNLRSNFRELLLNGLQDFRINLIIGQGPGARIHPII